MKIIEALKELPVLDKRIQKQMEQISEYAGLHNYETSPFGTPEQHKAKVDSLIQSSLDLTARYEDLKKALLITNTNVNVTIESVTKSIAEWIVFKNFSYALIRRTFEALNLKKANDRLSGIKPDVTQGMRLERMYDENKRNVNIQFYENLYNKVDGTLEIVNATTELQGLEPIPPVALAA